MRNKASFFILTCVILSIVIILGACRGAPTPESPTITSTQAPTQGTGQQYPIETLSQPAGQVTQPVGAPATEQPYPLPTNPIIIGTWSPYPEPSNEVAAQSSETTPPTATTTPLPSNTQPATQNPQGSPTPMIESPTGTSSFIPAYPGASPYPTIGATEPYPGPEVTSTSAANPAPATSTPQATQTPIKSATASAQTSATLSPTTVPAQGSGTPFANPTEQPPPLPLSPPPAGSSVTIWHSWGLTETDALQSIVQSFQRLYPDVTFSLQYIPLDDLFSKYYEAAYLGEGPSLLLGPSKWGAELFNETLITNLKPYVPEDYLTNINPAALSSGEYRDSLISLPLSQQGLLMFRNSSIISTSPSSMDELTILSHDATHSGIVGSYLERGSYFSSPAIIGLGGHLMDENGYPAFNDAFGLEWFDLLEAYDKAGAVTFNTNLDLDKFKQGRVGIIIDGSWNISMLAQSIGTDNLAIDPWPTYGTGHMSGWVVADSIYLNTSTIGNDRFAALSFMGYLLDPNVQMHLAEVGHIPSVMTTQPRDTFIQQAMVAFSRGEPYPYATDESLLSIYWNALDIAIKDVFEHGIEPAMALQMAENNITQRVEEMEEVP